MDERKPEIKIVDRSFLLYLLSKAQEAKAELGRTLLQKFVFATEVTTKGKGGGGLNYYIYKWKHGPFSKELAQDREVLLKNNLITDSNELTKEGHKILSYINPIVDKDSESKAVISVITKTLSGRSLSHILEIIYKSDFDLPNGKRMKIKTIPEGTPMIFRSEERDVKNRSLFTESTIETLAIMMNKEKHSSLKKAMSMPMIGEFKYDI
ncbi:MAG: hypothetical protein ABIJ92_04425 [Candidatus Aenigmatarchaeota archaeon]